MAPRYVPVWASVNFRLSEQDLADKDDVPTKGGHGGMAGGSGSKVSPLLGEAWPPVTPRVVSRPPFLDSGWREPHPTSTLSPSCLLLRGRPGYGFPLSVLTLLRGAEVSTALTLSVVWGSLASATSPVIPTA